MTSGYMFLALCLLLTQIPGFLMEPSDFDGYGDEQQRSEEMRTGMNSYDSFDNNRRAIERQGSWAITPMTPLSPPMGPPRVHQVHRCSKCAMKFWSRQAKKAHMKLHRKAKRTGEWGLGTRQDQLYDQQDLGYGEVAPATFIEQQYDSKLTEDITALIVNALQTYNNPRTQDYIS